MSKQMVEQDNGGLEGGGALTPTTFDATFADRRLWGAKEIGQAAGVSPETIRRSWAKKPTSPIRRVGGRLFAWRRELLAWMQTGT